MEKVIDGEKIINRFSKRLLNKLNQYEILTESRIKDISIEEFANLDSVGVKTVSEFSELKELLMTHPNDFFKDNAIQRKLDFGIDEELSQIPLALLKDSISNKLRNIFNIMGYETINDIINISIDDFRKMNSVGEKTVSEFESLILKICQTPNDIVNEVQENSPIEIPSTFSGHIIDDTAAILTDFFDEVDDSRGKDVLYKRFGLFGNNSYTLEEIGIYYGITRERVRQIEDKNFKRIRDLINGLPLKRPYIAINKDFQNIYIKISDRFSSILFIPEDEVKQIFGQEFNTVTENSAILYFLFKLLGFERDDYERRNYFFKRSGFDNNNFNEVCNAVVVLLQQNVKPITMFDIVVILNKGRKKISKDVIGCAVNFISCIDELSIQEKNLYQIKFHRLTSLKDMAYRIMSERKEELHSNEIFREIQHRLILQKQNTRETVRSLKGQLVLDDRFKPIGKTGKWVLSEWNHNTQSIIELVINAFHHYNRPCKYKDIIDYINSLRTDIRSESIPSILLQHKDKFLKIDRGTYILKEWYPSYPEAKDIGEAINIVTSEKLNEYLKEIFAGSETKKLTLKEIRESLESFDVYWSEDYCHNRIDKCKSLTKEKVGIRNYYSYIDKVVEIQEIQKKGKLKRLKEKIEDYIRNSEKDMVLLSEIASTLENQGEIRANIYGIISKYPEVFIKNKSDSKIYITLQGSNRNEQKNIKNIDIHSKNIQEGENKYIEFKSTLRWDIRRERVNKELEFIIVKAIAAFLNTDGGCLYIGVDDNSEILGIENDIKTLGKKNEDGFILHINQLLTQYFDKSIFAFVEHTIVNINKKKICVVKVRASTKPIYLKKDKDKIFVIRGAASVQVLDIEEANRYIQQKWK